MVKVINNILNFLKVILLVICFSLTFCIIIRMYQRLDKDIINSLFIFIPYFLLLILFAINYILNTKNVNNNIFYNITCCFVFITVLFIIYRSFNDKNMLLLIRSGSNINFTYFSDNINPIKIMLYGLIISNILLIFGNKK